MMNPVPTQNTTYPLINNLQNKVTGGASKRIKDSQTHFNIQAIDEKEELVRKRTLNEMDDNFDITE